MTISRDRAAITCSFCFTKLSWLRALFALGFTLSSGCTELADASERGLELAPDVDDARGIGDVDDSELPDDPANGDDGLVEGGSSALDAGRDTADTTRPAELADAGAHTVDAGDDTPSADGGASVPGSASCPDALRFQGSCYRPSRVALPWQDALDDCLAGGANLVIIDNAAEDAFVATLLGVSVWLGASDRDQEGTFRWTDARPLSFTNWGLLQPDAFPGQNCVEKRAEPGGGWYDQSCENVVFYVCERPLE